jgi:hypothetical protein
VQFGTHTHTNTSIGTSLRKFTIGDMGFFVSRGVFDIHYSVYDGITHVLTRILFLHESRYTRLDSSHSGLNSSSHGS